MATVIYYHTQVDPYDKTNVLLTTAKDHWDKAHCMDDGSDDSYDDMWEALTDIGVEETSDSHFDIDGLSISDIVIKMREKGFDMQQNDDFTNFVKY